jgi:putative hydrolase of the HAD superfamily
VPSKRKTCTHYSLLITRYSFLFSGEIVIKAVLFDMGSTLLEFENQPWEELIRQGIEAVYEGFCAHGALLPGRQEFCLAFRETYSTIWQEAEQSLVEMEVRVLLEKTALQLGLPLSDAEVLHLVRAHYRPVSAQVTIYADTIATLADVRGRGMKIGLVSNTVWPGSLHKEDLERFGIIDFFDHLLFSADVGIRKPHPQIFQTALEALKVAPHEAVFVGDRVPEDVAGAMRVGMRGVWKERPDRERLADVTPDAQIVHLWELLAWLDSWTERNGV